MSLDTDIILGRNVVVNNVSTLGGLRLDNRSEKSPVHASNLSGGVDRVCGIRKLQGYYWAYGDTPPVFPNDLFSLSFTLNGAADTWAQNTSVRCRGIEVIADAYDERQENAVYYIVHFGGAGVDFTTGSGAAPTDSTQPAKYCTKGLGLKLDGVLQEYIAGMHLRVVAIADEDTNSTLNGIAFYPAGDIDWTFEYTQRVKQWPVTPALDSVVTIQMATQLTAGLAFLRYWELAFGQLASKESQFDRKTRKPLSVQRTYEKCTSGSDIGHIIDPAGTTQWP